MKSNSHKRPKIRRRIHPKSNDGNTIRSSSETSVDQLLESTRKRMDDVRLTLEQRHGKDHLNYPSSLSSSSSSAVVAAGLLKGLLSQQQDSKNGTSVICNDKNGIDRGGSGVGSTSSLNTNLQQDLSKATPIHMQRQKQQQHQQSQQQYQQPSARKSSIIKDTIVERPFPQADPYPMKNELLNIQQTNQEQQQNLKNSMQIEGYTPTHSADIPKKQNGDIDKNKNNDVKMASNKTNTDNNTNHIEDDKNNGDDDHDKSPEIIEADVEFQCMTESEYKSAVEISHALGMTVGEFLSKQKEVIDEEVKEKRNQNESDTNSKNYPSFNGAQDDNNDNDNDEDGGEDLFSFFGPDSDDSDEDSVIVFDPKTQRPFITLWNALSTWVTPKSVKVLQQYRSDLFDHDHNERYSAVTTTHHPSSTYSTTINDTHCNNQCNSDIAISRCEGLMSIMKMNISKALEDLGYLSSSSSSASTRTDEHLLRQMAHSRLAEFIQSFDFSEPMVKFDTKMWYAMSVVLLEILLPTAANTTHGSNSRKDYEQQDDVVKKSNERDEDNHDSRTRGIELPSSIVAVDIGVEEYYYLTHTAIPSLSKGLVDSTEI